MIAEFALLRGQTSLKYALYKGQHVYNAVIIDACCAAGVKPLLQKRFMIGNPLFEKMIIHNHPQHVNAMVRLGLCPKPHILFGIAPKSMQKGIGTTMLRYSDVDRG